MKRFDDWPARLDSFLEERLWKPFAWGANDCCIFACDAVLAMTGTDLALAFRGSYFTARQALETLRKNFDTSSIAEMADATARIYKLRTVPASFAQRGDVMLLNREFGESLGIVSLDGLGIWAPGEERLAELPFAEGLRAWRI